MHCSANAGDGGDVAIFFGLSGTGKTTLSADTSRRLIGDDEHGWSDDGIFNIEGGCYAKVINLSPAAEPEIFATTRRFGTVLENVVVDPDSGELDLADDRYTENTRAAYPIDFIANAEPSRRGGHPSNIILLTADAFGVLPPVARLTAEQAMYHFLSGYTAKVAGTEAGVDEPEATFSACFGSPFLPQPPVVYAQLLGERIGRHAGAGLARQHRLDRRAVRRRASYAHRGDEGDHPRHPPGATRRGADAARSGVRFRRADRLPRRAGGPPRPAGDLGRSGGIRPTGGRPGTNVRQEFCRVRRQRGRTDPRRRARELVAGERNAGSRTIKHRGPSIRMRTDEVWKNDWLVKRFLESVRGGIPYAGDQIGVLMRLLAANGRPIERFLDLGSGSGLLAIAILSQYPEARATLVDFSEPMMDAARDLLGEDVSLPRFILADLAGPTWIEAVAADAPYDAVVSGFAIHHLSDERKRRSFRRDRLACWRRARCSSTSSTSPRHRRGSRRCSTRCWSIRSPSTNCRPDTAGAETRWRTNTIGGRTRRPTSWPSVDEQCAWLREAGLVDVDCFFRYFELAVFGGRKPGGTPPG